MEFRSIVGRNVKRLRLRNGWTQEELARRLQRHKQTVWAIEAGRHGINDRLLDDLVAVFGVPYGELTRADVTGEELRRIPRARRGQYAVRPAVEGGGAQLAEGVEPDPGPAPLVTVEPATIKAWIETAAIAGARAAVAEMAEHYRTGPAGPGPSPGTGCQAGPGR